VLGGGPVLAAEHVWREKARRSIPLGLALSAMPWLLTQFIPLNLPTLSGEPWHFNPFAWQFLMGSGMAAALSTLAPAVAQQRRAAAH
jgi:hypothetical protein